MKDWIKEVLNPNGNQSTMRVAFLWLAFNAVFMGWFALIFGGDNLMEVVALVSGITGAGAGFKVWQKKQENNKQ